MTLGGYLQKIATFHPSEKDLPPFPVLVFIATPQSAHWLGPARPEEIAKQVVTREHSSELRVIGTNVHRVDSYFLYLRMLT